MLHVPARSYRTRVVSLFSINRPWPAPLAATLQGFQITLARWVRVLQPECGYLDGAMGSAAATYGESLASVLVTAAIVVLLLAPLAGVLSRLCASRSSSDALQRSIGQHVGAAVLGALVLMYDVPQCCK